MHYRCSLLRESWLASMFIMKALTWILCTKGCTLCLQTKQVMLNVKVFKTHLSKLDTRQSDYTASNNMFTIGCSWKAQGPETDHKTSHRVPCSYQSRLEWSFQYIPLKGDFDQW